MSAVVPLPALQNDYISFGCFQNLAKVGDEVLASWGKILTALPGAKLRWQCKRLSCPTAAAQFVERLQQHGRRCDTGYVSVSGGTTTCKALWIDVPTLTLAGDTLLARQGAAAGMGDGVATSVVDYIDKAMELAGDLPCESADNSTLRWHVAASALEIDPKCSEAMLGGGVIAHGKR